MNEYFQTGAVPAPSSPGASSVMRQEFANIAAGFDKLPVLAGHANEIIFVDATGSRLETNGSVFTDLVTLTGTQEIINKTIAWASNTFTGFNDAATKVAGTGAGEVLLLAEADKLPALDGSLLTNLNQGSLNTVSIAKGGTGATDLIGAQANLGIDLKADANNAVLTGAPTAPTPLTGDASARIATTYFVADTMQAIGAFGPSSMNPLMNGVVSPGVAVLGSRSDHVHPTDTTRVSKAGDTIAGVLTQSDAAEGGELRLLNSTHGKEVTFDQVATAGSNGARLFWDGGTIAYFFQADGLRQSMVQGTDVGHLTRKDYVDTYAIAPLALKAPINSPTFTGEPKAPTPATSDNDTSIATTAFVQSLLAQQPPAGMQPSNSTPLMNGTAAAGTGVEGSRYDHVHPSDTSKQGTLVSGTNIKTVNNANILGSGNLLVQESRIAMGANDVDVSSGNYFTKTLSAGAVSLTISNPPSAGTVGSFILELTNAGLATITWPTGTKWSYGLAPILSTAGVDVLGFYSHDGGTTWRAFILAKDSK